MYRGHIVVTPKIGCRGEGAAKRLQSLFFVQVTKYERLRFILPLLFCGICFCRMGVGEGLSQRVFGQSCRHTLARGALSPSVG